MGNDVVIVGGGVAGLSCAVELVRQGRQVLVLEAEGHVGGRIATEEVDGFLLDRGFQVLQTGYPGIESYLDLDALDLQDFPSGVVIRFKDTFHRIADPRKHPGSILTTLGAPVGTLSDRFKMFQLVRLVTSKPMESIFNSKEETALAFLKRFGFSDTFINSFFIPFFAGATLERSLDASSHVLKYLVRVFTKGNACLPAGGMGAIPKQLFQSLPSGSVRCNARVASIRDNTITLAGGEEIEAEKIVLAVEEPAVHALVNGANSKRSISETCIYFSADWKPPFSDPFLVLNGEEDGPINNIAFPSMVSARYAPAGKTLIAVVVLGEEWQNKKNLTELVIDQSKKWFGEGVETWKHLKTYTIDHALPAQSVPVANPYEDIKIKENNLYICGEHKGVPGLLWALMSGRKTAQQVCG